MSAPPPSASSAVAVAHESQTVNDDPLAEELDLPRDAQLNLPDGCPDIATFEATAVSSGGISLKMMISISTETCLRGRSGRALVVGRLAATADLRIQHKTMSRQHAILYYVPQQQEPDQQQTTTGSSETNQKRDENDDHENDTNDNNKKEYLLYLTDLGGKHGTTLNGQRIPANEPQVLKEGDRIQFGNVRDSIFLVRFGVSTSTSTTDPTNTTTKNTSSGMTTEAEAEMTEKAHSELLLETAGQGLTGRAKREAELAAMMESLDSTPTYQRYTAAKTTDGATSHDADAEAGLEHSQPQLKISQQHRIPIAQTLHIPSCSSNSSNSSSSTAANVTAATTCMAIDPSGSRFVLGSRDFHVRLYDFSGMTAQYRTEPFQMSIPHEGYGVVSCAYSNTGDRFLVGTASPQPVVMDREGRLPPILQFVRGDGYVADQTKTMGHVAAITAVDWHPLERDLVLTASMDGTARLWNLATGKLQFEKLTCQKVFAAKSQRGTRTAVTSVCFHPGGRYFALGTACGSLQIWNTHATRSHRPEKVVQTSHTGSITWLQYTANGSKLASRSCSSVDNRDTSGDSKVLIWNTSESASSRLLLSSQPAFVCHGLPTRHEEANFCFSPNGQYGCGTATALVASETNDENGTTTVPKQRGSLNFYSFQETKGSQSSLAAVAASPAETRNLEPILALETAAGSTGPVLVQWHKALNQILVAYDNGSVTVYADANLGSKNGALLALQKGGGVGGQSSHLKKGEDALTELLRSRAPQGLAAATGEIVAPFATTMTRRKRRRDEEDTVAPEKLREPERPVVGKHKAGRGGGVPATLQQFVADQAAEQQQKNKKTKGDEGNEGSSLIAGKDPRVALLQYSQPGASSTKKSG